MLHVLLLGLPYCTHHLAALAASKEVGAKLAFLELLPLCSVCDDVVVLDPELKKKQLTANTMYI